MKHLLLATSLLASITGGASAADLVTAAPAFSWTGGYAGAQAGYFWGEGCFCIDVRPEVTAKGDVDGWLGGVYAGYNRQFANNVVLGVDVDVTRYGVHDFVQYQVPSVVLPERSGVDYKLEWGGAARLRAGYAMGRFLPYVAGGVTVVQADLTSYFVGSETGHKQDTMVGWTLGGGIDYALTDKLMLRTEYRYSDFGSFDLQADDEHGRGKIKGSEFRFGVAYKF